MANLTPLVLQLHEAQRAGKHYDLRLQIPRGNKLASWALTKAKIPKNPGDKVLAIRTEDHNKSWLKFQGKIPEGSYGAGNVKIEQKGQAEILLWNNSRIITFIISGFPMNGKYTLIKFKTKENDDSWLLVKGKD